MVQGTSTAMIWICSCSCHLRSVLSSFLPGTRNSALAHQYSLWIKKVLVPQRWKWKYPHSRNTWEAYSEKSLDDPLPDVVKIHDVMFDAIDYHCTFLTFPFSTKAYLCQYLFLLKYELIMNNTNINYYLYSNLPQFHGLCHTNNTAVYGWPSRDGSHR